MPSLFVKGKMQKTKGFGLWYFAFFALGFAPIHMVSAQTFSKHARGLLERKMSFERKTIAVALSASAQQQPQLDAALRRALEEYAKLPCAIELKLVAKIDAADIVVTWVDAKAWTASKTFAANTRKQTRGPHILNAQIELNGRYEFENSAPFTQEHVVFLPALLMHELGHALGLNHSRSVNALMRAGLPDEAGFALEDIAEICVLY